VIEDPGTGRFGRRRRRGGTRQSDWRLWRERGELRLIDIKANFGRFPFDGVDVEAFGEVFTASEFGGCGEIGGGAVGERSVNGAVNGAGLLANIFHDVDLAALRPADSADVVAEHPERGPDALPFGNFDARFETAESLREETLCFQPRGRVFAGDVIGALVVFFAGGDDEIAVFDARVLRAVRVGLEFVIAPAVAAEVVGPFFGIGGGAVRTVEFVGPDQREIFESGRLSGFRLRRLRRRARRARQCRAPTNYCDAGESKERADGVANG
jgi:hypothetical protein